MEQTDDKRGHRFGGAWTELKLQAVEYYFSFFTSALKRLSFELWYIDGFAGSGTRTEVFETGGLLSGAPVEKTTQELAGSVLKALDIDPPFKKMVFIEGNEARFRELDVIRKNHPDRHIECRHGEANEEIKKVFSSAPWSGQRGSAGKLRAVVFLDPYGMSVEWETLKRLAATRSADVWYLFPIQAATRQLANDLSRVDSYKQNSLDDVFGTPNWREELYKTKSETNLFSDLFTRSSRQASRSDIEKYARERLGSIFCYVSDPLPLLAEGRGHIFSLFCLSNSDSVKAISLIKKGVAGVKKKYGQASHRKYGR